ncbi:MAG: O-antigen ligase family protein, partial [Chloroflexi bacterium]|nr:O-antigen ligase family protein [Chloroflexota bacterium]
MSWILGAQEFLWLLMVVGVPLAFLSRSDVLDSPVIVFVEIPKIALLRTAAAAMAALWMVEWAIGERPVVDRGIEPGAGDRGRLRLDLSKLSPRGWLIAAVAGYFGVTMITTLLSASVEVSLWGEVPGQDGYPAYTMAAYAVLFAVVTTHLKTKGQLGRLIAAFVASGVLVALYAVSQHFGQDFLVLASPVQPERATSIMGNAIYVGSVLLMTVSVTVTAATLVKPGPLNQPRFWLLSGTWAALLTIQLLGIVFTFSRGPWVGLIFAVALFLALAGVFAGWRTLLRGGSLLAVAALLAWLVLLIPAPGSAGAGGLGAPATASQAAERLTSISGQVTGGSFGGRWDIWTTSWRLMNQRPWVEFDNLGLSALRPLVGYGPDLYRTAYLLESRPRGERLLPGEAHQAHNYFLHAGVEMGYLGLAASLALFAVPFLAGGYVLFRWRNSVSSGYRSSAGFKVMLAGLIALLAGRFLEQMVGIARVSDLTLFWAALGLLAALPAVFGPQDGPAREPKEVPGSGAGNLAGTTGPSLRRSDGMSSVRILIAALCILGLTALTWEKTLNHPLAAIEIGKVNGLMAQEDLQEALAAVDR